MYSRRRDSLGCQAAGIRIGGVLVIVAVIVWIGGRALEGVEWLLRAIGV